jgi:hypothetical protein
VKVVHRTAFSLEVRLGDKPPGTTTFLKGIQGEVSRPVWNRDYFYLNAKVQQVYKGNTYRTGNCLHIRYRHRYRVPTDVRNK